jgi:undecaprenyl-diphosphatase
VGGEGKQLEWRKRLFLVNVASGGLFMAMLLSIVGQELPTTIDSRVKAYMELWCSEWVVPLVTIVTDMNSFWGAALFSLAVIVFFIWKRWIREIGFYLVSTLGATGLFALFKIVVGRTRPAFTVLEAEGYSFPSGHTTMATAMAFSLYFILYKKVDKSLSPLWFFAALGWALLIAFTRVYLGVHWFTDVVGGFGLGLWWVTLTALVWYRHERRYYFTK